MSPFAPNAYSDEFAKVHGLDHLIAACQSVKKIPETKSSNSNQRGNKSNPRTHAPSLPSRNSKRVFCISENRRYIRWSAEEDNLLTNAVRERQAGYQSNKTLSMDDWIFIASEYFANTRNEYQCKSRWSKSLDPKVNKKPWETWEDKTIVKLRLENVSNPDIAKKLATGRTAEQIRDRFVNKLDPSLGVHNEQYKIKTPWSQEELRTLYDAQKKIGNKWTAISTLLPGRSEADVKNQWHNRKAASRRALRRICIAKKTKTTRSSQTRKQAPTKVMAS